MKLSKIVITNTKKEIVKLYIKGYTHKEIAKSLNISHVRVHTVWHSMLDYCIKINNWNTNIKLLPKKILLSRYGASIIGTLEINSN